MQRTRAPNVAPVYEAFVKRFPRPDSLANASEAEILRIIRPLGLAWRAALLKQLGVVLAATGKVPSEIDKLIKLPGVGHYVAAAYASFHEAGRGVIIDANVVRFLSRLTGNPFDGETRRKRWLYDLADSLTPSAGAGRYNYAVLDFTMGVCTPRSPRCEVCPLGAEFCAYGSLRLKRNQRSG